MTDVLLVLCFLVLCWMVLCTDLLFQRTRQHCASCGNDMYRGITICTACDVTHHVGCWECRPCGVVVRDECAAHSNGPVQRLTNWWKKDRSSRKPATS